MLATKANLGVNTIRRAEEPGARLSDNNAERVVAVLREAGVEFVERDGVLGLALNFLSV
jgi:hypothetical protein